MSKMPFAELNNPPFLLRPRCSIATTLRTASAFALALVAGRLVGWLSFREGMLAGLAGSFGMFVIAGHHDTWIEPASVAVLIGTFASVITLTSVMWFIQTGLLVFP
jgi:malonate transporter and related proteins